MRKDKIMNEYRNEVLKRLQRVSEEGVLLYKEEKLASPADIAKVSGVKEDAFYNLEFIVKDDTGKVREMWFGNDKKAEVDKCRRK